MESITVFFENIVWWRVAAVAGAMIVVTALVLVLLSRRAKKAFWKKLTLVCADPRMGRTLITDKYSPRDLLKRTKYIEAFVKKNGPGIIPLIGIDDVWMDRFLAKKRRRDFRRILEYIPEKGLFPCFLLSLERMDLAPELIRWLENTGDLLLMRRIGLSSEGRLFDGKHALERFRERLPEIRELMGDPEWTVRHFAVQILLHDSEERSIRAVWNAFKDSSAEIRKTIAAEFHSEQKEKMAEGLVRMVLDDPVQSVRKAAWTRLQKDFSDFAAFDPGTMEEEQAFHVLELLRADSKDDENMALKFLENDHLELRFAAVRHLEKTGVLHSLCADADPGDRETMKRTQERLEKAVQVNVTSFLSVLDKTWNPATFQICAGILLENGDREYISTLAKKVFSMHRDKDKPDRLYRTTVDCIVKRGNEEALRLLNEELRRRKSQEKMMDILLPVLPPAQDNIFFGTLVSFLRDPGFVSREALRDVLCRMPKPLVLREVFNILRPEGEPFPHAVQAESLKVLTEMRMTYCLQTILENLPVIPVEDAESFARILSSYPAKILARKIGRLLDSTDARTRASVLSILPVLGDKSLLKPIRDALKDADPEVRIAGVWAAVAFEDAKSLERAASMLRDPVERVRIQSALALGSHASKPVIRILKDILFDENEVPAVKTAAVRGLGASRTPAAVDALFAKLEKDEELKREIMIAFSRCSDPKPVSRMIEHFKDADPTFRTRITDIFKTMGESGEQALAGLLREDIPSLNPYIVEILEATGYIETLIRRLSHKDPAIRKETASFLSLVGTTSAFRGIVLAARDPDEDVRVQVTKALEKLETKEGKELLKSLESDPDRRVRKYTHWALERLRSKSL